jgi:hypothetical protein
VAFEVVRCRTNGEVGHALVEKFAKPKRVWVGFMVAYESNVVAGTRREGRGGEEGKVVVLRPRGAKEREVRWVLSGLLGPSAEINLSNILFCSLPWVKVRKQVLKISITRYQVKRDDALLLAVIFFTQNLCRK